MKINYEEKIHNIRVAIKRLDALSEFLGEKSCCHRTFKSLGKIRDKQIIRNLLFKYSLKKKIKEIPLEKYEKLLLYSGKVFVRLEECQKKIVNLKNREEIFTNYQLKKIKKIKEEKDLHKTRKNVKSLCFVVKELKDITPIIPYDKLKTLESEIGKWHDLENFMHHLCKKEKYEKFKPIVHSDLLKIEENIKETINQL